MLTHIALAAITIPSMLWAILLVVVVLALFVKFVAPALGSPWGTVATAVIAILCIIFLWNRYGG